jgi:nucleoside phosphorylase
MNREHVIAVLAAMKREVAPFLGLIDGVKRRRESGCMVWHGKYKSAQVRVVATGMASDPPVDILKGCSAMLSTGFCGALQEELHTGDVVVSSSVAYADKDLVRKIVHPGSNDGLYDGSGVFDIHLDQTLLSGVQDFFYHEKSAVYGGRTVTCARVIRNSEEKHRIGSYFDALAVDMEDYGRLRITRQLQVPMWCLRAVLDEVEDSIPGSWSGVGPRKLSKLLGNIPPAQQSICRALTHLLPAIVSDT